MFFVKAVLVTLPVLFAFSCKTMLRSESYHKVFISSACGKSELHGNFTSQKSKDGTDYRSLKWHNNITG